MSIERADAAKSIFRRATLMVVIAGIILEPQGRTS
jgi:hypothetical protein